LLPMLELEPTSIHASSQKGMRPQHPRLNRSRRDTPSFGFMFLGMFFCMFPTFWCGHFSRCFADISLAVLRTFLVLNVRAGADISRWVRALAGERVNTRTPATPTWLVLQIGKASQTANNARYVLAANPGDLGDCRHARPSPA